MEASPTVDAHRRLYRLKPEPLQEVDAWLAPFRSRRWYRAGNTRGSTKMHTFRIL